MWWYEGWREREKGRVSGGGEDGAGPNLNVIKTVLKSYARCVGGIK